jgi:hypothetical protein
MSTVAPDNVLESQNEIHGASALAAYENNRLTAPDDVQGAQETPTSETSRRQARSEERDMGAAVRPLDVVAVVAEVVEGA